jgi:hypothetical protein
MKMLFCSCHHCKRGRDSNRSQAQIKCKVKGFRMKVRRMLRKGEYEMLPTQVAIGYTD